MLGRTVGNYVIERKLGEGGMGAVYLARHPRIGKEVAVKVLLPALGRDPELVQRFFQEARAAAEIKNAHIVDVLDFGELDDGASYIVMEWLEGRSLADLLKREGKLALPRAQKIARGIGRALSAAHARGIVHRDLKPDNIFLISRDDDPEFVKVLDFGIAKLMGDATDASEVKTRAGAILGTPHYMSPEQCQGGNVDARADVYSLGVILYQMVTGRLPFEAAGFAQLLMAHLREAPPPPRTLDPSLPIPVEEAVLQALAKDPELRFSRVEALVTAFTAEALDLRTPAPQLAPPAAATNSRRGPMIAAAAVALVALLLVGARLARGPSERSTPSQPSEPSEPSRPSEKSTAKPAAAPAIKPVREGEIAYGGTWTLLSTDCPAGSMPLGATVAQSGKSFVVKALGFAPTTGDLSADGHFSTKSMHGRCRGQVTGRVVKETCTNWLNQSCHASYQRAD